ncbi:hypothetical protein CEUSTIGMA_g9795.t1 [Chlamydomonas eustigma]|uniref:Uncharacterized protein n=1 Tax=Chlamydomonas eustigma TaxID=1157962 RepID=A0A250XH71_9CHLO|nr:hypothetical protein CEUSTIGMA_g9795.t1 [Chlamydomonas eustigma]|eukprot:GAX82366.1 hypothetical protein CEUSTIGMA_g9795.t1 [Chlamydomonas eustigma]
MNKSVVRNGAMLDTLSEKQKSIGSGGTEKSIIDRNVHYSEVSADVQPDEKVMTFSSSTSLSAAETYNLQPASQFFATSVNNLPHFKEPYTLPGLPGPNDNQADGFQQQSSVPGEHQDPQPGLLHYSAQTSSTSQLRHSSLPIETLAGFTRSYAMSSSRVGRAYSRDSPISKAMNKDQGNVYNHDQHNLPMTHQTRTSISSSRHNVGAPPSHYDSASSTTVRSRPRAQSLNPGPGHPASRFHFGVNAEVEVALMSEVEMLREANAQLRLQLAAGSGELEKHIETLEAERAALVYEIEQRELAWDSQREALKAELERHVHISEAERKALEVEMGKQARKAWATQRAALEAQLERHVYVTEVERLAKETEIRQHMLDLEAQRTEVLLELEKKMDERSALEEEKAELRHEICTQKLMYEELQATTNRTSMRDQELRQKSQQEVLDELCEIAAANERLQKDMEELQSRLLEKQATLETQVAVCRQEAKVRTEEAAESQQQFLLLERQLADVKTTLQAESEALTEQRSQNHDLRLKNEASAFELTQCREELSHAQVLLMRRNVFLERIMQGIIVPLQVWHQKQNQSSSNSSNEYSATSRTQTSGHLERYLKTSSSGQQGTHLGACTVESIAEVITDEDDDEVAASQQILLAATAFDALAERLKSLQVQSEEYLLKEKALEHELQEREALIRASLLSRVTDLELRCQAATESEEQWKTRFQKLEDLMRSKEEFFSATLQERYRESAFIAKEEMAGVVRKLQMELKGRCQELDVTQEDRRLAFEQLDRERTHWKESLVRLDELKNAEVAEARAWQEEKVELERKLMQDYRDKEVKEAELKANISELHQLSSRLGTEASHWQVLHMELGEQLSTLKLQAEQDAARVLNLHQALAVREEEFQEQLKRIQKDCNLKALVLEEEVHAYKNRLHDLEHVIAVSRPPTQAALQMMTEASELRDFEGRRHLAERCALLERQLEEQKNSHKDLLRCVQEKLSVVRVKQDLLLSSCLQ